MTLQMAYDEKYREGLETGMQLGVTQGRENGIVEEKEDTARRMLSDGTLTLEQISTFTGLSLEQIQTLKKSM